MPINGIKSPACQDSILTGLSACCSLHFQIADVFLRNQLCCTSCLKLFNACRWVRKDSWESEIFAVHSIILCFMCGPIGLLSHMLTKELTIRWHSRCNRQSMADKAA